MTETSSSVCLWLPSLETKGSMSQSSYEDHLYRIFVSDFIHSQPIFKQKNVGTMKSPRVNGREQAFYHITTKGETNRTFDSERSKRIRWIKAFIEHYDCNITSCLTCNGIKAFKKQLPKWSFPRIHIYFEEEDFIVVLEERKNFYMLITAYYVDQTHTKKRLIKNYNKYKSNPI